MTIKRQIVSAADHFGVHDYSEDVFTYHCHEGCPGHDVRSLDCKDKSPKPTIVNPDELPLLHEVHAEANAELDARIAGDEAEDRYLDQLDTMGGMSPDARTTNQDRPEKRD